MSQPLHVAYRSKGRSWENPDLVEELCATSLEETGQSNWCVLRWSEKEPQEGGLRVHLSAPSPETDRSTQLKLAELIHQKLSNGFYRSSLEKGWPLPRFFIIPEADGPDEEWTYWLELGPHHTEPVVLHPNKVLAVGEEEPLSLLLGLECVDPVFGLPAKWVTYSQAERAANSGCLLFEAAEVIMSHAISYTESRMVNAVGHWEVTRWLAEALPSLGESACRLLEQHSSTAVRLVRGFLDETLFLPQPADFAEAMLRILSECSQDNQQVEEQLRAEVVRHNLPRWLDSSGSLLCIEWKGPAQLNSADHHRMLNRLSRSLMQAQNENHDGLPVLMVEASLRKALAGALESLFPELPVLGWNELEDLSNLRIVSSVNADLKVEATVIPAGFFSTDVASEEF